MRNGLYFMLDNKIYLGATLLYNFMDQVTDGLEHLKKKVSEYVRDKCRSITAPLKTASEGELKREQVLDLMKNFVVIKNSMRDALTICFNENKSFRSAINEQFEIALNDDELPIARFLALFIDELIMEEKNKQEAEIDAGIEDSVELVRFVKSRDLFEKYYQNGLRIRLLCSLKTDNLDTEKRLLDKLRGLCDKDCITRARRMIDDILQADTVSRDFSHWVEEKHYRLPYDLSVTALPRNDTWSITCPFLTVANLPDHISRPLKLFNQEFLAEKFLKGDKRKLMILPSFGFSIIQSRLGRGVFTLVTNTVQMLILDMFNTRSRISFSEIVDALSVPERDAASALMWLSQKKVVRREKKEQKEKGLVGDDVIFINSRFTSATARVTCFKAYNTEKVIRTDEGKDDIAMARSTEIQAAIVRVMKTRKTLDHEMLFSSVCQVLAHRFIPSKGLFKKEITVLLDKGFLARTPKNRTQYNYIS